MEKQERLGRGAGILLPVFSLPSPYGIGTLGREAHSFVDFLHAAGQCYWQVLPLGPTSYGDSPYQSFSAFAGNPYLIDLAELAAAGLLTEAELSAADFGETAEAVDYGLLWKNRIPLLRKAFARFDRGDAAFARFEEENASWLPDYRLFMALKVQFGGIRFQNWPEKLARREHGAIEGARSILSEECSFWTFCQYQFFSQWDCLKAYANQQGVSIIGDIPIYAAGDSADVWAQKKLFQVDEWGEPLFVAGVSPDCFSATGQLWGNPLYDYDAMRGEGFAWWRRRMAHTARLYDLVRIDHFVGIAHYYSIPAGEKTAEHGQWLPGPGQALLDAISDGMGGKKVIAENLGVIIPAVGELLEQYGYPGMKVLGFAFDSDGENENLPAYYEKNTVVYGGTHDNQPLYGFFEEADEGICSFARRYLHAETDAELSEAAIRAVFMSAADTAIFQMQDYLGLGSASRLNTPATMGQNWKWRLTEMPAPELAEKLRKLTILYGRARK